jgi:hypothetical protein
MKNTALYEQDFFAWTLQNAQLLREGNLSEADILNIAEELESMGKHDKRALLSRLTVLLMHLLKWQYQVSFRSKSWELTIKEQRRQIEKLLKDSPSLKRYLYDEGIHETFADALEIACDETGLPGTAFPEYCPYRMEQLLDKQFFPD